MGYLLSTYLHDGLSSESLLPDRLSSDWLLSDRLSYDSSSVIGYWLIDYLQLGYPFIAYPLMAYTLIIYLADNNLYSDNSSLRAYIPRTYRMILYRPSTCWQINYRP